MKLADAGNAPLSPEAVAELRHELRTPVNLIVGYCEMLLEDATGPGDAARRAALEEALAAVRDVLARINTALPGSRADVAPHTVTALYESLREPQARIVRAMASLLTPGGAPVDQKFADDVRKIRHSAERLLAMPEPAAVPAAAPDAPAGSGAGEGAPDVSGRPLTARILVVDDVEDNRSVLQRRLERQGYAVECAGNGRQALELVARRPFDLVLLDILMPDLDGYAVLERLKAAPATRDIPVIMISALDDLASVVRCIEGGAEDHLPKPFDPVLLRARIGACLEKKRLRDVELEYLREVGRVIEAATAVEAGHYESGSLAAVARRADELGRLARVFDTMAAEVRSREERLRQQVDALRREIDEARHVPRPAAASPARDHYLPTGELFAGRYEILEEVGSGGMGMVYKAHDRELGDLVAIKTLRPELVSDATLVERFKSEIRLARRISHKNVVRTHDFGESAGVYYLTMEFVEGITVRELLDTRGHLSVSATLGIAAQLAQSLAVAHEQGVIHRDIKPQNLLLDGEGVLKVMDFGVARLAERTSTLTEAGLIIGTPAYMAPEQLLAEAVDARSDLYAVGVVLYECATGKLPFEGSTPVSLIAKVFKEEPRPPAELNADVPPALSALILRLLAKRAEERVASAAELGNLLAEIQ